MAYLFGDPDDQQQKTSIFGEGQTVAAPGQTAAPSAPATDTTGANYGSGGGASAGPNAGAGSVAPASAQASSSGSASPSQISTKMASLSSRQKAPDLSGYSSNLSAQEQKLQSEANTFTANAQAEAAKLSFDKDKTQSAIDGNIEAVAELKSRLSNPKAQQVEAFKGLGTVDAGTSLLQDSLSQASLFRGSTPSYTAGQQAFDARLLNRNKDFQSDARGLVDREIALQKASDTEAIDRTKSANDLMQSSLDAGNQQTTTYLRNSNRELETDLQNREAQEEAIRAALNPSLISNRLGGELFGQIRDDFKGADPTSINFRSLGMLNPSQDLTKYLDIDRDVDWRELVSQGDADRHNRVLGLLGDGGQSWVAGGGAGEAFSFDRIGAKDALLGDAVGRRQAQDLEDQKAAAAAAAAAAAQIPTVQIPANEVSNNSMTAEDRARKGYVDVATAPIEIAQQTRDAIVNGLPSNVKGAAETILNPITPSNQLEKEAKELAGRVLPRSDRLKIKTKW